MTSNSASDAVLAIGARDLDRRSPRAPRAGARRARGRERKRKRERGRERKREAGERERERERERVRERERGVPGHDAPSTNPRDRLDYLAATKASAAAAAAAVLAGHLMP